MPAVAGGDKHGIDIGAFGQELAQVAVQGAILVTLFAVHETLGGVPFASAPERFGDHSLTRVAFAWGVSVKSSNA